MPFPRTLRRGQDFTCEICQGTFYRTPGQIARGATHTCSKQCLSSLKRGDRNPFWGRTHTPESLLLMSRNRTGKAKGNTNATGHRHSKDARKLISLASRQLWAIHRDRMLQTRSRGLENPQWRGVVRHRRNFTPMQRREWRDSICAWCGSTERLELDHVIPVWFQNIRLRENAQTLCRHCNLWKLYFVEHPMFRALQAAKATTL